MEVRVRGNGRIKGNRIRKLERLERVFPNTL